MRKRIVKALKYWYRGTLRPRATIRELRAHPHRVAIAFWINLIFALLYSFTVLMYYAVIQRLPAVTPWIPVPEERYYFYQTFWTVPWALATWIMISGICHLLASTGRRDPTRYAFKDALVVCGLAWVVPNLICMWMPETLLVPIFGVFWPAWIEVLRLMVIPPLWQTALVALGLRETHEVGWLRGTAVGLLSVLVFFIMFLAFMR